MLKLEQMFHDNSAMHAAIHNVTWDRLSTTDNGLVSVSIAVPDKQIFPWSLLDLNTSDLSPDQFNISLLSSHSLMPLFSTGWNKTSSFHPFRLKQDDADIFLASLLANGGFHTSNSQSADGVQSLPLDNSQSFPVCQ